MPNLILPDQVTLRLVDATGSPLRVAHLIVRIQAFARYKNDYLLEPFVTNAEGEIVITKAELEAEVSATLDSGLMDYHPITECDPEVAILALSQNTIDEVIDTRTNTWKALLKGEETRWRNIQDLISVYRNASNSRIRVSPIRVIWDGRQSQYVHSLQANLVQS